MPEVSPKFHMEALAMAMINRKVVFQSQVLGSIYIYIHTKHGWLIQDIFV